MSRILAVFKNAHTQPLRKRKGMGRCVASIRTLRLKTALDILHTVSYDESAMRIKNPWSETKMENGAIRVVSRAFSILVHLAQERRPLGISEIAESVALPKATVYRILDSLVGERAVMNRGGEYELGPVCLMLADAYRSQTGFAEAARPHLRALRDETKETVHLFAYERGEFYYLDKLESPYQVRMHSRIGAKASLFRLSAGKALLARLSPDDMKELPEPVPGEVAAEFQEILSRGFAVDDEQNERGLRCVGAAVFDGSGRPLGAVSVSAPVYRFSSEMVDSYGLLVKRTAEAISKSAETPFPRAGGGERLRAERAGKMKERISSGGVPDER